MLCNLGIGLRCSFPARHGSQMGCGVVQNKSLDHLMTNDLLYTPMIEMSEAAMPQSFINRKSAYRSSSLNSLCRNDSAIKAGSILVVN